MGGSSKKAQSADAMAKIQREAAKKEQIKLNTQAAEQKAREDQELQKSFAEKQSQRQAFATGIAGMEQDDENRRKFLKGV